MSLLIAGGESSLRHPVRDFRLSAENSKILRAAPPENLIRDDALVDVPPGRPPCVAYRLFRRFRLRIDFRSHLPLLPRLKMSQKSSLPQSLETVQLVLTGNSGQSARSM